MDHDQQGNDYITSRRSSAQSSEQAGSGYVSYLTLADFPAAEVTPPQSAHEIGEDGSDQQSPTSHQAIGSQPLYDVIYNTPPDFYATHSQQALNTELSEPTNVYLNGPSDVARTFYGPNDPTNFQTSSTPSELIQRLPGPQTPYSHNGFERPGWAPWITAPPTLVSPPSLYPLHRSMVPLGQGIILPFDGQHSFEQEALSDGYIFSLRQQMDITSGMPAFLEPHSSVNMIYNQQFGTVDSAPNLSRRNAFRRRSHENGAYREHTVRPSRPRIVPPYNTESGSFAPIEVGYESQLQLSPRNTVVNATKSRSRRPRNNTPTSREPLPRSLQDGERSSPNSSSLQMQRNPSQDQLNQYQNPTQLGCISDVSPFGSPTSSDAPQFPTPDLSSSTSIYGSNAIHNARLTSSRDHATSKAHINKSRSVQRANSAEANQENYKCGTCPTSYTRKDNLVRHVNERHNGSIKWRCPMCSKEFPRRHNGIEHVQKGHGAPIHRDVPCAQDNHKMSCACARCPVCRNTIPMKNIVEHFEETPCAQVIKSAYNTDEREKYFEYWYPRCCGPPSDDQ